MTNDSRFKTLAVFGTCASLLILFSFVSLQAVVGLLWGWLTFLVRVGPQVRVRWDGVAFFVIGLALCIVLAHSLLVWLVRSWAAESAASQTQWRLRSTVALVSMFLMVFVIGIALAGVTHQIGWLLNSDQPRFTSSIQSDSDNARSNYRMGIVDSSETGRSMFEAILPYLPHIPPQTDRALPWNAAENVKGYKKIVPMLINPSGSLPLKSPDGLGLSHFAWNARLVNRRPALRSADIENSNTLMLGETNTGLVPWAHPDNSRDPQLGLKANWGGKSGRELGFGSPSKYYRQTMFAMFDGSVRSIDNDVDDKVLQQLIGGLEDDSHRSAK